jgi:hypothetical protein
MGADANLMWNHILKSGPSYFDVDDTVGELFFNFIARRS